MIMKKNKKKCPPKQNETPVDTADLPVADAAQTADADRAPSEPAEAPAPTTIEEECASLKAERDALNDKLLRAQAECANITKRLNNQHTASLKRAGMHLARALLPVLDSLEKTLGAIGESEQEDPVAQGVRLITEEFHKVFRDHEIVQIEALHKPFDPMLHEAMMRDHHSDQPPGTVTQEYQRGYTMHDRVLRPAKVVVAAEAIAEEANTEEIDAEASSTDRDDTKEQLSDSDPGLPDASSAEGEVSKR